MAYGQGGAVLRPDLRGVVEEAFNQDKLYIGIKALPAMPVPNKFGQYPVIRKNSGDLLRNEVKARGSRATYARIQRAWETDNYNTQEYGMEALVDDGDSRNIGRFFDLESFEIRRNIGQVKLAHEIRAQTKLIDNTVFSTTTSGTAYTAANLATFDIGLDVDTAKQAIIARGEDPMDLTLVMSANVFYRARASTKLQNRVRGTSSTDTFIVLSEDAMAKALEVKQVLVGRAAYDTSPQGASASTLAQIWGDTFMWLGKAEEPSGPEQYFNGGTGFTIFWEEDSGLWQVESYREDNKRSEVIRARHNTDEKIVLSSSAQLIATQYS